MGTLRDAVGAWAAEHFEDPQFDDHPSGTRSSFGFPISKEKLELRMFVDVDEEDAILSVFGYIDLLVPEERRDDVHLLLALTNPTLRVGAFELHPRGRVRFRCAVDLEETTPSSKTIDNQVSLSVSTCGDLLPALLKVLFEGVTPAAALAAAEQVDTEADADAAPPDPTAGPFGAWLEAAVPLREWSTWRGVDPIARWAGALKAGGPRTELSENAVVFVGPDIEPCESVARLAARDAGYRFAFVPRDDVQGLSPALLRGFSSLAPVMVFLQAGQWSVAPDSLEGEDAGKVRTFQQELLRVIKAADPARPVLFATSAGSLRHLADPLTCVGGFDLAFAVPEPSPAAQGEAFLDLLGREVCAPSLLESPGKVGKALALAFRSKDGRALTVLHLKRLAARERRKVEFVDLIEVYTRGFVEAASSVDAPEGLRPQVAVHEAGHAAMAVLDSNGADVPDFSTIIPSNESRGVVVSSLAHRHDANQRTTYEDFRHVVRVSLAGRAAEELMFGPSRVANGAMSDLENATRMTYRAFTEWGYAPAMSTPEASRSNLAVVVDTPAPAEIEHNLALTRRFLDEEYTHVLTTLRQHRAFLEAVRDRLLVDPVVDRAELTEICGKHGLRVTAGE